MPAMRATSRRRCWSRRRRPISRCSTTRRARSSRAGGTSPVLPERSHYFDAGVDQKIPFGCYSASAQDCTTLDLGLDAYYKIAKDLIDNGTFGQALGAQRLQLRQGHRRRRRVQRQISTAAVSRPMAISPSARRKPPSGVEPISVRQRHAARRSRRLDRVPVHPDALDLHRSHPVRDRLGRAVLSILRPAFEPRRALVGLPCAARNSRPT